MVATFFLQQTTAFILFLIVPSIQISFFRKTKEIQYVKYNLNKCITARLIWQLVIHCCVIFAYIISRRDGQNNGFLAGVSLPPSLLARPSCFRRVQNPLSLFFQTPATQAMPCLCKECMKCWFARAQDNFCPYYQGLMLLKLSLQTG